MARIFISYKRTNKEKVFPIVKQIEEHLGIKCWVDLDGIESSAQFASVICKAIDVADVVLFMHSFVHLDIDFESDWTIKELNYAQAKKKRIVLVKLDSAPLDNLFLMDYGSKNNIDSTDPVQLSKLISDLRIWLALPQTNVKVQKEPEARLHRLEKDKKFGFVNAFGDIVIPCIWNHAEESFDNGLVRVQDENGKWGFLNQEGNTIIPCQWNDAASKFSEGLLCVKNNKGKWGYIDKQGDEVLRFQWDEARPFSSGLANVKWKRNYLNLPIGESKWGTIDKNGDYVLPNKWLDCGYSFHEGMLNIKDDKNLWGYIDINGKVVIPCRWTQAGRFCEGLACFAVKKEFGGFLIDRWGFVDKSGQVVISPEYFIVYNFYNGITNVKEGTGSSDRWKIIDKEGHLLFSSSSLFPLYFQENLACVGFLAKGHLSPFPLINGFVDMTGREVIPSIWKSARAFSSGLAPVQNNDGKWGYIDKNGMVVIPCQWEDAESFDGDYAWVKDSVTWYLIDKEGQYVRH